jgi:rhomboid protease GluP
VQLSPRWRYKIEHWKQSAKNLFGGSGQSNARPKICPACGSLVGTTATKCYQCGASLRFSTAAMTKSLSRLMPSQSPITYVMLCMCCLFYGISLLLTLQSGSGMGNGLFDFGGIDGRLLIRMGSSLPLPYMIAQPWRLVTACFLHGSLLHIGFNMWVLMDVGPMLEELYGSARYFFFYLVTGIFGYVFSSIWMFLKYGPALAPSIGASGALLGLIGLLIAATSKRSNPMAKVLRSHLIWWVVIIFALGFFGGMATDNAAHLGGLVSGFLIGRYAADRAPIDMREQKRAQAMGWTAGAVMVASFASMFTFFYQSTHQKPEPQGAAPSAYIQRNLNEETVLARWELGNAVRYESSRTTIAVELSGPPRSSAVAIN